MFPGLSHFPEGQIIAFALIFLRIIAMLISWPVFGTPTVPIHVKVLLAVIFSVLLFPTLKFANAEMIQIGNEIIFLAIRELAIGLTLGFLMRMFFFAISIAGEMISVSIGLASAQLYNPAMGSEANVVEQFQMMLATLFFLSVNGHHIFISGLAQSFELVPVAALGLKTQAYGGIEVIVKDVFVMGLKMSAPVMAAVFITNIAMGIIGRAVPQINVLVTSMPVTVLLGLAVMIVTVPLFIGEMNGLAEVMASRLFQFMKVL